MCVRVSVSVLSELSVFLLNDVKTAECKCLVLSVFCCEFGPRGVSQNDCLECFHVTSALVNESLMLHFFF